jgi:hypothetical protein
MCLAIWCGWLLLRQAWQIMFNALPLMRYPRPIKPDWVRKEIVRLKALMPDAAAASRWCSTKGMQHTAIFTSA